MIPVLCTLELLLLAALDPEPQRKEPRLLSVWEKEEGGGEEREAEREEEEDRERGERRK